MKTNISKINRLVRSTIGLTIIGVSFFALPETNYILAVLGAILVFTGLIGFCPIDHYFHMKQRR